MKFVKYIGTKPLKRDEITGLLFEPGQVHPVDDAQGARMTGHTDMYLEVDPPEGAALPDGVGAGLADVLLRRRAQRQAEDEAAAYLSVPVNVGGMNGSALESYALREFGVRFEPGMKEPAMRERVVSLVRGREFDVGVSKIEDVPQASAVPKPAQEPKVKSTTKRRAPLVIPPDPRDLEGLRAQNDGPQPVTKSPLDDGVPVTITDSGDVVEQKPTTFLEIPEVGQGPAAVEVV